MTDAIGPSAADVARALAAARQSHPQSNATASAAPSGAAGRSGHEGDSVTLSQAAQEIVKIRLPDGSETEARLLSGLKLITPQGQRAEAEAAIGQVMADLGIEGDLEFSIKLRDDGSIAVQGGGAQAADIEAALNADPALQQLLRNTYMTAKFAHLAPSMQAMFDPAAEDAASNRAAFDSLRAERHRVDAAAFTFTMTQGALTTAFVDAAGQRFGGMAPEPAASA